MHRVIDDRDFDAVAASAETARTMLRDVVRARVFDERAISLQRRGWMSGYPPFRGQEASQVGLAHAMADDDPLFPTYRANAVALARGVPMAAILAFRRGHSEFALAHDHEAFPQAVPIASQLPHAVGAGIAANYRGDDAATVAYFGEGATSEGDFHEAMNFAGVFGAPVVFFCENNGWAISMPEHRQTRTTVAAKADAYGFDGGRVDGNDPLAVRELVASGLERARDDEPVLVESLTYRQGAHTTSDDPSRYEHRGEFPAWRTRDPLGRFETYLVDQGVVGDSFVADAREAAEESVDEAVADVESMGEPGVAELFEFVYEELPPRLADQRAWLEAFGDRTGVGPLDRG